MHLHCLLCATVFLGLPFFLGQLNGKLHDLKIHKAADALADGQLLASEETVEVRQAVPQLAAARRQADMTHAATHRRVDHRLSGVCAPVFAYSIAGCSWLVASRVADVLCICPVLLRAYHRLPDPR